ncbi:MAG: hypothetical protein Q8P57_02395 [Candidatus Pacearchaeota archaeon]|nr:hypothetical protein [Candidatus Pacearchaeota archaeon]
MGRTLLSLIALTTISLGIILSEPSEKSSIRLSNKAPTQKIEREELKKSDETKPISIVAHPYTPEKESQIIEEPEQETYDGSKQLQYLFNESEFFKKETWELYTIERIETLTSNIPHLITEGKFLAVFKDVTNGKKTILKEHKYPNQKIKKSLSFCFGTFGCSKLHSSASATST